MLSHGYGNIVKNPKSIRHYVYTIESKGGSRPYKTLPNTFVQSIQTSQRLNIRADTLQALAVVVVLLLAGRAGSAAGRTSVTVTTALAPLSNGTSSGSSLGRSRLSNGSESSLSGSSSSLGGGRLSGSSGGLSRGGSGLGGGSRSSGGGGGGAVPDLGAGGSVAGEAGVDVEEDTGVGGLVGTGEGDTSGEGGGAGALNLDVDALHVELGTALAVTLVEGVDLGTEDIVAGGEVGESQVVLTGLAGVGTSEELVNSPLAVAVAILPDLGPRKGRASLASVDHDGTLVGGGDDVVRGLVVVVVPLESDLVTTLDGDGLGSLDTSDVAGHGGGSDVGDGVVVRGRVDVTTLGVANTGILAVDEDVPDGGVSRGELASSRNSENLRELHCD